jgi:hypothetical protein
VLPSQFLPYTPHHVVFIGGFDDFGTQTGGQLIAVDDGDGNIVGDVDPGGTINYETGAVAFLWNTMPPPITYTDFWGRLLQAPDGSITEFDFEVRDASGGGGSTVSLDAQEGLGRLKFVLSDLTTPSVTIYDAWDNAQGDVDGDSLVPTLDNYITYEDPSYLYSLGKLNFAVAPEAAAGQDFKIQVGPVTQLMYTVFCGYIMSGGAYDKYVFANNEGKILGDVVDQYPYSRLDFLSGKFHINLSAPSVVGQQMTVSYHPFIKSKSKDIPIDFLTMPTLANVTLTEMIQEINV